MIGRLLWLAGSLLVALVVLAVLLLFLIGRGRLQEIDVTQGEVTAAAGTYRVDLEHGGRRRYYLLHVPPQAAAGTPLPLLLALHGGGGRAETMDDLAKLTGIADREGFLIAFPQGVAKNWNDGRRGTGSQAEKEDVDDVGFLRAVVEDAAARLAVDRRRVYATGISNGAMMSSRLACEAADVIAAVAPVVGTAPEGFQLTCKPGRPVPVIAFLSTDDPLVPFGGGQIEAFVPFIKRGRVVSADAFAAFWAQNNGCAAEAQVTPMPDRVQSDRSRVVLHEFGGCRDGATAALYVVEGGGHTWPGGKQYLTRWLVGRTNRDVSASELIWRFFADHPRP